MSEVARDLGVGRGMLTKWRKQLQEQGVTAFPGVGARPDHDQDAQQLRRDLRRVRQERDILKKRWRSSRNARDEVPDHQATVRRIPGAAVVQDARGVLTAVITSGEDGHRAREREKIAVYVCRSELRSGRVATGTEVRVSTSSFGNEAYAALASG